MIRYCEYCYNITKKDKCNHPLMDDEDVEPSYPTRPLSCARETLFDNEEDDEDYYKYCVEAFGVTAAKKLVSNKRKGALLIRGHLKRCATVRPASA